MSECKWCHNSVEWRKVDGKNVAFDQDGVKHDCPESPYKKKVVPPAGQQQVLRKEGILKQKWPVNNNILLTTRAGDETLWLKSVWSSVEKLEIGDEIEIVFSPSGIPTAVHKLTGEQTPPPVSTAREILEENKAAAQEAVKKVFDRKDEIPLKTMLESSDAYFDEIPKLWSGETRLTIGVTINLDNYENLKIEVQGPAPDRDKLIQELNEVLDRFGKNEITRGQIQAYQKRVIG